MGSDGLQDKVVSRFDRFWSCYPRKVGRGAAAKAWGKINPDEPLFTQMILSVDAQQRHRNRIESQNRGVTNERYKKFIPDWPHPATWINQQRWLDEIPSVQDSQEKVEEKELCHECAKKNRRHEAFSHCQNPEKLCSWHFSEKHYSEGPTGLNALRMAYKQRIPRKEGESVTDYLRRSLKTKSVGDVQQSSTGQHQTSHEDIQRQSNAG